MFDVSARAIPGKSDVDTPASASDSRDEVGRFDAPLNVRIPQPSNWTQKGPRFILDVVL